MNIPQAISFELKDALEHLANSRMTYKKSLEKRTETAVKDRDPYLGKGCLEVPAVFFSPGFRRGFSGEIICRSKALPDPQTSDPSGICFQCRFQAVHRMADRFEVEDVGKPHFVLSQTGSSVESGRRGKHNRLSFE